MEYTAADGKNYKTKFYNLDAILSVGYRVNSRNATLFRQFVKRVLRDYLLKGYVINQRIEQLERTVASHGEKIDFFVRTSLPPIEGIQYVHDRFIIIDNNDLYHIGASLKDLGKKLFAFSKMDIPASAIMNLL